MADGDQDKAQDRETPAPGRPAPEPVAANQPEPGHAAAPQAAGTRAPSSEWTVSDRRGPLDSADDEDVERFVPEHETDAVGIEDRGTSPPPAPSPPEASAAPDTPSEAAGEPPVESPAETHSADLRHVEDTPRSNEPISVAPASVAAPAAVDPPPERRSALPLVGGLVGGAVLGAAIAALIFTMQTSGSGSDSQVAALAARVQSLEARPNPQKPLGDLQASLAELGQRVTALQRGMPGKATTANSTAPSATAASGPSPDGGALQQKVADLAASVDKLQSQTKGLESQAASAQDLAGKLSTLEAAVSGAQKQASTAQSSVDAVQAQQKSLEGKVGTPALAVVTDSLIQQIDHGEPFVTHVDALASLGADPGKVAVLKQYADKGVPSAATLAARFAPLAEPMVAAMHQAPPNAGMLDRLKSGMAGLVTVRRSDSTSGNDVPSRISRIETALAQGDVTEAYETWNLLPSEAKAKSEAWGALAKTSAVARAAARSLQREAIVSLGAKKS